MTGKVTFLSFVAALALAGCTSTAPNATTADTGNSQRAISADIDASLNNHGPNSAEPGMKGASEQIGAVPTDSDTGAR